MRAVGCRVAAHGRVRVSWLLLLDGTPGHGVEKDTGRGIGRRCQRRVGSRISGTLGFASWDRVGVIERISDAGLDGGEIQTARVKGISDHGPVRERVTGWHDQHAYPEKPVLKKA